YFFFQAEDGIRDYKVTGVQTCALPISFREDLYYRLKVVQIRMPSLREISDDIPLLAKHFLAEYSAESGRRLELSPTLLRRMMTRSEERRVGKECRCRSGASEERTKRRH